VIDVFERAPDQAQRVFPISTAREHGSRVRVASRDRNRNGGDARASQVDGAGVCAAAARLAQLVRDAGFFSGADEVLHQARVCQGGPVGNV